jgi:hypothetical protein
MWLGLTMGCAECHDHKFDPITAKDFYAMKAFFADIKEDGILPGSGPKAWAAMLALPSDSQTKRLAQLKDAERMAEQALENETADATARQAEWERRLLADYRAGRLKWQYQRPLTAVSAHGATLSIYNDEMVDSNFYVIASSASLEARRQPGNGLIVAGGPNPDQEIYTVRFKPGAGTWNALGVQAIQDESLPAVRLARGADRFLLSEVEAEVAEPRQPDRRLRFVLATTNGTGEAPENAPALAIDGNPATGWGVSSGE